jgi:SAM-dependent methyltransferase
MTARGIAGPGSRRSPLRELRHVGLRYRCPICGGRWRSLLPVANRERAECPRCGSYERHRLLWLYLSRGALLSGVKLMLHVAPEPCLERRLSTIRELDYVSGDLEPRPGQLRLDVTALPFEDRHFDAIICSHVLEHVPDDRRALSELSRVLRPDGWAILLVPILRETTIEDPNETDPAERLRRFGQRDHVRVYGDDFYDRLRDAGFGVTVERPVLDMPPAERERYGLTRRFTSGSQPERPESMLEIPVCRPVTTP